MARKPKKAAAPKPKKADIKPDTAEAPQPEKLRPTDAEKKHGWTSASLQKYLAERDDAVNNVHGLGIHASQRARRIKVYNAGTYDPWSDDR